MQQEAQSSALGPRPNLGSSVGKGHLGQVWTLTDSSEHIAEEIRLDALQESEKTSVRQMLRLATTTSHPNIIPVESILEIDNVIYASIKAPLQTLEALIKGAKESKSLSSRSHGY